ncbi:ABC transporter ATP-binding protein [Phenylobacterium sp.]|jgi:ATP-binding cassette subfamily B protein|uniref:ABC transporter ATP-binding protein n=1 Tax=Phenylobacterium sp. TaxID=1871053 RepID=UPI002F938477
MLSQIRRAQARADAPASDPHPKPRPGAFTPAGRPAGEISPASAAAPAKLRRARLRRFLSYYRPHLPLLAADLACAMLVSGTALLLPLCANYVTKRLTTIPDGADALGQVWAMGGLMLAVLGVQAVSGLFVDYQGHVMGAKMEARLRHEVFAHCQKLSFSFHDRQRVGQLMSRITHDLHNLGELYHHGPEDLAIAVLKLGGAAAILAMIDLPLTLLLLVSIPLATAYALVFNRRMMVALKASRAQIAIINERVEDALGGVRVVQAFANEALEVDRFEAENRRFLESRRSGYRSEAFFSVGLSVFGQLLTVIVIVAGAVRVAQAGLSVADLLTFLLCVAVLVDPIQRLANFARLWQQGYTGFTRVMEILEVEPDVRDWPGAAALSRPRGDIAFHDVSFRYGEGERHVLRGLDLHIRPGEFVAIVGPSGAGKSTLCALIPRFYDVTAGAITIDGGDVRDVQLSSLRGHIGLVQQDVYLFAGTVAENLLYGRPDASWEEVVAAAKAANAHDFIMALPNGYDTDIGQRGVKLSGGQKQRLTIARAFLKDPAILIFDEATSALDNDSERAVQQALGRLASGRTTIVIAHRLSTVQRADRIIVLAEQGIVEEGTHHDLLAAGGAYARLYRVQGSL